MQYIILFLDALEFLNWQHAKITTPSGVPVATRDREHIARSGSSQRGFFYRREPGRIIMSEPVRVIIVADLVVIL